MKPKDFASARETSTPRRSRALPSAVMSQPAKSPQKRRRSEVRLVGLLLSVGLIGFATAACSEEPVEQTVAEMLAEIEGRELTPAEVAERQEVADFLCGVDDQVLRLMWKDMTRSQLEFQDFVFGQACRGRSEVYAAATGRFSAGDTSTPTTIADDATGSSPSQTTSTTSRPSLAGELGDG